MKNSVHGAKRHPGSAASSPERPNLLQRKCACGGSASLAGDCETCQNKKPAGGTLQKKLTVNKPGDRYEQEADRAANAVMGMTGPGPRARTQSAQGILARKSEMVISRNAQSAGESGEAPPIVHDVLNSSGQPLDASTRAFMEPRFGHDFSNVKIHTDAKAAQSADSISAAAYTVGENIVFGAQRYAPDTSGGQHLLAHELSHVIQQQSIRRVQRQHIPIELWAGVDISQMFDEDLQKRYDLIQSTLAGLQVCNADTLRLEKEAGDIGVELARRRALADGRTFSEEAVKRMRDYFIDNAKTQKDGACIVALNKGVKMLLNDPKQPTTNESIEKTMEKIAASGRSGDAREIYFKSKSGKITRGSSRPETLAESVWDAAITMADKDPGWSVFTMSLLDGYHTVTLTLDNTKLDNPHIYWSDQWGSKGGWMEYTKSSLDAEVTRLIQGWWDKQAEGKKHTTVVRLWRLRQ